MANLKEEAQGYEPKHIRNISELKAISIDVEVFTETEVEFPYKYIVVNGERYKMPLTIIADLKEVLEEKPDLKDFKVKRVGEGKNTKYTLITL